MYACVLAPKPAEAPAEGSKQQLVSASKKLLKKGCFRPFSSDKKKDVTHQIMGCDMVLWCFIEVGNYG